MNVDTKLVFIHCRIPELYCKVDKFHIDLLCRICWFGGVFGQHFDPISFWGGDTYVPCVLDCSKVVGIHHNNVGYC